MATSYDLCSHSYLILCRSCPKLVLYSGIQAHKVVEACNKCWRWGYGCGGPSILCLLGRQSTVRWCKVTYLTYGEIWITFVGLGLSTSLTPFSQDLCLIASWLVHGQRAVSLYPLPLILSTAWCLVQITSIQNQAIRWIFFDILNIIPHRMSGFYSIALISGVLSTNTGRSCSKTFCGFVSVWKLMRRWYEWRR